MSKVYIIALLERDLDAIYGEYFSVVGVFSNKVSAKLAFDEKMCEVRDYTMERWGAKNTLDAKIGDKYEIWKRHKYDSFHSILTLEEKEIEV